jgi:tetratricopeptide (TPR) repeat protein
MGDLATRFRDLRTQAGLTKTALARPRYTVSYVSQIEAGRRKPSLEALSFFSGQLGVTPEYLRTGVPDGAPEGLRYRLEHARLALRQGDSEGAETIVRGVIDEAAEYGLATVQAMGLSVLGDVLVQRGRVRQAIDAYEESLQGGLPARDRAFAVAALGRAYRRVGDLAYAVDVVESFLSSRDREPLDPEALAHLQTVLVSVYFERGDVFRAERAADRALTAVGQGVSPEARARTYWDTGRVLAEARRWEEALEYATRARLIMEDQDDRRGVARLHNAYAFLCLEVEPPRLEEAGHHLDEAERILGEVGSPGDMAYLLTERSRLALLQDRPAEALAAADSALALAGTDELEVARALFLRGRGLASLGRHKQAADTLHEAAAVFEKRGARQQEASCWRELGEIHLAVGDFEAAVDALREGLRALDPRRSRA